MLTIACLPAYNEENKIYDVVKETSKFVDKVIVCDDGSDDQTEQIAKKPALLFSHTLQIKVRALQCEPFLNIQKN